MPVKTARRHYSSAPRHHKHTKVYLKTYWPYLPMLLIIVVGLFIGTPRPLTTVHHGVLAYATNTSSSGLLQATNAQRTANGQTGLNINSQLAAAAQNKANDMVARDYWSHNTPDGQEPWVFIQNAGYQYTKAGENLAYGFTTSSDTVTGWMNSPTHKANLLDSAFSEVGFGVANSNNFNASGQETVVVAMYGEPKVLGSSVLPPPASSTPVKTTSGSSTAPSATSTTPTPTTFSTKVAKPKDTALPKTTSTQGNIEPASQPISRIQTITKGRAPWVVLAVSSLSGVAVLVLLLRHGWGVRRLIKDSENFILHHALLDTILVSIVMMGYVLTRTSGIIR